MKQTITRKMTLDAGHRVPNHSSKCRNLHGHTYTVYATVESPSLVSTPNDPQEGMVVDFSFLTHNMRKAIHDPCDHRTILTYNDPLLASVVDTSVETISTKIFQRVYSAFRAALSQAANSIAMNEYDPALYHQVFLGIVDHISNEGLVTFDANSYTEPTDTPLLQLLEYVLMDIDEDEPEITPVGIDIDRYLIFYPGSNPMSIDIGLLRIDSRPPNLARTTFTLDAVTIQGKEDSKFYVTRFIPTAENLARHWAERLKTQMYIDPSVPPTARLSNVTVGETPNCSAGYDVPPESVSM